MRFVNGEMRYLDNMPQWTKNFVQGLKDLLAMPPVVIDGSLYVIIAYFGAATAFLGSDEASKFISPLWLFWLRGLHACGGAMALALKMFRSTSFSDSKPKEIVTTSSGETTIITKQDK